MTDSRSVFLWLFVYAIALAANSATVSWDGEMDSHWHNPTNWAGNILPGTNDTAQIVNGGRAVYDTGADTVAAVWIGRSSNGKGTLDLAGGALTANSVQIGM
jgi:hypothetical protein